MDSEITSALKKVIYRPESRLSDDIWRSIKVHKKRNYVIKIWIYSSFSTLSLLGLIPAVSSLSSKLNELGFYNYLSLAFSSNGLIISYWREVVLSVVNSLPVLSIVLSLSLLFISIISFMYAIRQIRYKSQLLIS